MQRSAVPVVLLLLVTAVWGATFVLVQNITADMAIFPFLFWRFAIAAVALAVIRPQTLRMPRQDYVRAAILGSFLATGYVTQTIGLQHTSATVAGFITGMFVVFTPLLGALLFRQRIPRTAWLATVLALIGLGFMSLQGWAISGGELLILICALGFAAHVVFLSRWTSAQRAFGLTIVQLFVVALICLIVAIPTGGMQLPPSTQSWLGILFLAVVATAAAYLIQTWAQSHLSATRTAVILTMEPVFAGIFGVLLAGDTITWRTVVGGLMILAAMYLVELDPKQRTVAVQETPHP